MPAFMARPPSLPCSSPTSRHVPLTALAPCDGRLPTLMKEDSGTIETAGVERAVSLAAILPHQESRELARDPSGPPRGPWSTRGGAMVPRRGACSSSSRLFPEPSSARDALTPTILAQQ